MNPTLPDKPSALIRLAIEDLEKVEKMKTRVVDMGCWHQPRRDVIDFCYVCLAGAVMDQTLKVDQKKDLKPYDFEYDTKKKLYALDSFRRGCILAAFKMLRINLPEHVEEERPITKYDDDKEAFKKDMLAMADYLENQGY